MTDTTQPPPAAAPPVAPAAPAAPDIVWYRDGSTGCKRCNSASGYFPSDPGKVHDFCDCPREEQKRTEPLAPPSPPGGEPSDKPADVVKSKSMTWAEETREEVKEIDNCDSDSERSWSQNIGGEINAMDDVVEYFPEWSPPQQGNTSVEVEVEARHYARVIVSTQNYSATAMVTVTKWALSEDGVGWTGTDVDLIGTFDSEFDGSIGSNSMIPCEFRNDDSD